MCVCCFYFFSPFNSRSWEKKDFVARPTECLHCAHSQQRKEKNVKQRPQLGKRKFVQNGNEPVLNMMNAILFKGLLQN